MTNWYDSTILIQSWNLWNNKCENRKLKPTTRKERSHNDSVIIINKIYQCCYWMWKKVCSSLVQSETIHEGPGSGLVGLSHLSPTDGSTVSLIESISCFKLGSSPSNSSLLVCFCTRTRSFILTNKTKHSNLQTQYREQIDGQMHDVVQSYCN